MRIRSKRSLALGLAVGAGMLAAAVASAQEEPVHHHRHRRGHRRLLSGRRRHLPAGQCRPPGARDPLLGREHGRLGLQRQHHAPGRARLRHRPERRAVQRLRGRRRGVRRPGPVRGAAGGVRAPPRAVHPARPRRFRHRDLRRPQGRAGQRQQSRLRLARHLRGADGRQGLDHGRLRARLRAQVGRAELRRSPTTTSTPSRSSSAIRTARSRRRPPPWMPI